MRVLSFSLLSLAHSQPRRGIMSMHTALPRVAVVGGGLSGIAAARELIQCGIQPVIYEADYAGGLWSTENKRLWKSLKTNLSKYTCALSYQPWPAETPTFPTKHHVDQYLQSVREGIPIHTSTRVSRIERVDGLYQVTAHSPDGQVSQETFDNVIVATGFFCKPTSSRVDLSNFSGRTITSDQYVDPTSFSGEQVAVVGGSFSGCEIAAEIAKTASCVYHVVPRHCYVLPTHIPESPSSPSPAFLPLDLAFYTLSEDRRRKIEEALEQGQWIETIQKTEAEDAATHAYLQSVVGPSNNLFAPHLFTEGKAHVVISDDYRRMVKLGKVKIVPGRLQALTDSSLLVQSTQSSAPVTAQSLAVSVTSCVIATGLQPDLSILSDEIRSIVYETASSGGGEGDGFSPFMLHREISHPDVPGLYFVGMYRGPYFGVVELQSRLVAQYIAGAIPLPTAEEAREGLQRAHLIRSMRPRSQFPHPDYVGMLYDYARALGTVPNADFRQHHRTIVPAFFTGRSEAVAKMEEDMRLRREEGRGVGRAIMQALAGDTWTFTRRIHDQLTESTSIVNGTLTFTPIAPDFTHLLYQEKGQISLPRGGVFDVTQHYVYHYDETKDTLEVSFSTVGKPEVIDRPFVSLRFQPTAEGWEAKAYHLCSCDNYHAWYRFRFEGLSIVQFDAAFDVAGPEKKYRAETTFLLRK